MKLYSGVLYPAEIKFYLLYINLKVFTSHILKL